MGVVQQQREYKIEERSNYKDMIFWRENKVRLKQEDKIPGKLGWWRYNQLKYIFKLD